MKQYPNPGFVARIHLKTGDKIDPTTGKEKTKEKRDEERRRLINFCLHGKRQYVAIGWSSVYKNGRKIKSFDKFSFWVVKDIKRKNKRAHTPQAINLFSEAEKDCLFWTRDLDGYYWICRATGKARCHLDADRDIGAVVPVEAYKYGLEVAGQIRATFTRSRGQTTERIDKKEQEEEEEEEENDEEKGGDRQLLVKYSKFIFNECRKKDSKEELYFVHRKESTNFLNNLSAFDLEELVIAYLQIEEGYYVLSNSIANKSTTIKIECELLHRETPGKKAVVQVKASGATEKLRAKGYEEFVKRGYDVYLYCSPGIYEPSNKPKLKEHVHWISPDVLQKFVNKNEELLPDNIMKWKDLFRKMK